MHFLEVCSFDCNSLVTDVARALREIRYYQRESTGLVFPQSNFHWLVREIAQEPRGNKPKLRWERDALFALQTMSEHVLTMFFEMMCLPPLQR